MTATTLTTDSDTNSDSLFSRQRAGASVGAVALVSLLAFEAMAVAAAMPAIAAALDGIGLYALAFGGMLATSVLGMVLAGRSCDRHGAWRATAAGLAVFFAGLLLAGFANGMGLLVTGRIVQGLGAGMLGVALYVGMGQVVPPVLHPRLFALMAAAWVLPGLVGPLLAATLVEHLGWRSVFLVVALAVPLTAALLLPAFGRLGRPNAAPGPRGDNRGPLAWAVLAAAGALMLHGAGTPQAAGWRWPLLAAGAVGAAWAARHLLPAGSLRAAPGLPAVIALRGLLASTFASAEVFIPLYLTREAGWSLAQAGGVLSAAAVTWSAGSAVQARITEPLQRQRALQGGFALVAGGLLVVIAPSALAAPPWLVVLGWPLVGFGIGLSFPMLSVLTLKLSAQGEQGRNASALQLSDALCSSAVLALCGALFNAALERGPLAYAGVLSLSLLLALAGAWLGRRAFA